MKGAELSEKNLEDFQEPPQCRGKQGGVLEEVQLLKRHVHFIHSLLISEDDSWNSGRKKLRNTGGMINDRLLDLKSNGG